MASLSFVKSQEQANKPLAIVGTESVPRGVKCIIKLSLTENEKGSFGYTLYFNKGKENESVVEGFVRTSGRKPPGGTSIGSVIMGNKEIPVELHLFHLQSLKQQSTFEEMSRDPNSEQILKVTLKPEITKDRPR